MPRCVMLFVHVCVRGFMLCMRVYMVCVYVHVCVWCVCVCECCPCFVTNGTTLFMPLGRKCLA